MRSSCNRRTDYNVLLACVFVQECGVRRQHHHIQGRAGLGSQFFQAFTNLTLQYKFDRIPCRTLYRWAGKVRREIQHRQFPSEGVQPVRFLTLHPFLMGFALLPYGIIFVLNPQWRQLFTAIQTDKLISQDLQGHPI
ncbi:hypothetical protein D1872_159460 [compost metagenome]